eukprot:TCONS_00052805-protein
MDSPEYGHPQTVKFHHDLNLIEEFNDARQQGPADSETMECFDTVEDVITNLFDSVSSNENLAVSRNLSKLNSVLHNQKFQALLNIYSRSRTAMNAFNIQDNRKNAEESLYEVTVMLNSLNDYDNKIQELKDILAKPHVQSVIKTHDTIIREMQGKNNIFKKSTNHDQSLQLSSNQLAENVTRVRLVQFPKNPNEPMGITLKKTDKKECLVARVIHGGMIHRQGTLHVGDEIKEINGINTSMCSVERLQQILRDASGDVTFKIVPGCQNEDRASKEVYFKCLYDYDPRADDMIPCQQAGLSFQCGDVLEVVCKADMHWWQARKVGTKNVGLVPSTELQEQRIRKMVIERNKGEGAITCLWPKKTNKKSKVNRYTARLNTAFDRLNLVTYEEVIQQKKTYHKTIVLIGAHGVGRRHIKNSLVSRFPEKYASPVPHTSRRQSPNEKHGELWFFETEDRMLKDIGSHQYLEYGKHDGHLYGTKLSSVQDLIKNDRTPVLDIETPALKILRCKEFFPYIIFVSSPISYPESGDPKMDASLQRLIADSTDLKNRYQHFFDYTVINETIDETVEKIVDHLEELAGSSAWIPASWYY